MGAAVGAQLAAAGHEVLWASEGRSGATARRAAAAGLRDAGTMGALLGQAETVLCICPPASAQDVAAAARSYTGTWVEANAVAPDRVRAIAGLLDRAVTVDGAVIGSPPRGGKRPRLYLSGPAGPVARVAALFDGTLVEARDAGRELGRASALKLAYSAYQKPARVLAAVAYALAAEHGVEGELLDVAALRPGSYLSEAGYIPRTAARAWRWGPEMLEAADALSAAGLPGDLAEAAAAVLARWPRRPQAEEDGDDPGAALRMLRR